MSGRAALAGALSLATLVLGGMAEQAGARTVTVRANLDGDRRVERVERLTGRSCGRGINAPPRSCGQVRIVDGRRARRITPRVQRRYRYGWSADERVTLADLTGDGRPEVIWRLFTAGGTASSPALVGVTRWTGRRARRLLSVTTGPADESIPGSFAASPRYRVLPERDGLRELEISEPLIGPDDATCCASHTRTRVFRYDGRRLALVPGSERVTATAAARRTARASARTRRCGGIVFTPRTEDGIYDIRARGTGCRMARRVARAARPYSVTRGPYRYRTRGYTCRGRLDDSALPVVSWRCRRGRALVTFERA